MLTNMFEPDSETEPGWDQEIRDDVIDECNKYGGVLHIYVDKSAPQGNVYVKCPTVNTAVSAVNALLAVQRVACVLCKAVHQHGIISRVSSRYLGTRYSPTALL